MDLPILITFAYITQNLYLNLIEEDDPFFTNFINFLNLKKYINKLPSSILDIVYNNKYLKLNLNPDSLFPIYYMLSCCNTIKSLLFTWYQEGNAKNAAYEMDIETSLLLYYNRSKPTLIIFFIRAFFTFIISIIKDFELEKYSLFFISLIYRSTDYYYFIYYILSDGKGYPKILQFWRLMEFVLIFSILVFFLFQFLKYCINENLSEFKHIMSLRFREYSLKDNCHDVLFKLAEQTLQNEGSNGFNFHSNHSDIVSLPTSYYCYNYYKNKKLANNIKFSNKSSFSLLNKNNNINNSNNEYSNINNYNTNVIQQRIENSNFKYQNWVNPNYHKYRNLYNLKTYNTYENDDKIPKLNKINTYNIPNSKTISNKFSDILKLHYLTSFINHHILRNNNNYNDEICEKLNNKKKENWPKKNWKSNISIENNRNHIHHHDYTINNNKSSSLLTRKSPSKMFSYKNNPEMNEYKKFLYDTYDESQDEDLVEDPLYTDVEICSDDDNDIDDDDNEEKYSSSTINSMIKKSPKDSLYHELYDIMQDDDILNELKNQNIIVETNEVNQQNSCRSSMIFDDDEDNQNKGMITRLKYHKLLNTDAFMTASESLSNQTSPSSEKDNVYYNYKLPLRDASISYNISKKEKSQESLLSSSSNSSTKDIELSKKDPYEFYRRTCVVCFDAQREIILWPCGCLCLCDDCREIMTFRCYKRCPCCQQEVHSYSKINLPLN
ncbi:hypothetical protein BCR32DRAFT_269850 [Anaeromyces robustus]|uniref:RING-type domain-containing protein n=1 Tax=Anaeromyces robustus TaxID=1754192 RepID=A0A1Y1X0I9_9FUNG|nr:hypothetical protein BCR32DRAFT_269850 [Anaeromyces robustus]|eukprot:ORX78844.1 hypothetical protein BCR32DRAFT_269850 [Anaeromyces robustus]